MGNDGGNKMKRMVTRKQISDQLNISTKTVSRWEQKGWLKPFRIGKIIRYRQSEVDALIQSLIADARRS